MKKLSIAVLLFAAACASTPGGTDPMPAPVTPAPDPRVADLQTQLTELLERIDVLNDRIAKMEESAATVAPSVAPSTGADRFSSGAEGFSPPASQAVVQHEPLTTSNPATTSAASAPPPPQRAIVGANIAEDYRQAIMLVGRNRQADARRAFEAVYDADPNGDLADNALFWIGETYFAAKDYTSAVRYYMRVVSDYSSQNKAPDALFKTAIAQERTGDLALARRTLQQVIERYPYSTPASSAKAELERIKY
jgi:tol-pal system protein YbgF